MNSTRAIIIAVLLCGFCRPGAAAPAFVYQTPGEFISSGDFNGDGIPDVLVLDIVTGNARVGYSDANGNLTWSAPLATGLQNPTGCAIGRFQQTGWDTIAVTAPTLNCVNLVDLSLTNTVAAPVVVTPPGLGPHGVLPLSNPAGVVTPPAYNSLLVASSFNSPNPELLDLMSLSSGVGTLAGEYPESGPFDQGNALQLTPLPGTLAVGTVTVISNEIVDVLTTNAGIVTTNDSIAQTNTMLDIWQFTNSPSVLVSLSNLVTGSYYTFGVFNGETLPRFIFYQPGTSNLTVVQLLQSNGVFSFGTPLVTNVSEAIQGIFYVNLGGDGSAMIQFSDGVEGMSLPGGVPSFAPVYNSGATAGNIFTGVVPMGSGQFALLDAPPGSLSSAHAQVIHFDGTHYTQRSSGNLPATTTRTSRANVWLFQTEPFVNRQAGFIASFNSPDWTEGVSGLPGGFAVQTDTDNGTNNGLSASATNNLGAPPTGSGYGLVNQYSSAISLFSYGGPQPAQPVTVSISPPPGIYDGPIAISFNTLNPSSDQVYYRVGTADSWHHYAASFTLTNDNTIQYYGTNAALPLRSQLQLASYTLGKNNQLANLAATGNPATNLFGPPNLSPSVTISTSVGTLFYGRRSANNNGTIWAINMDGSDDTYVTTGVRPRASKDGFWLAFMREGNPFNNQGNLWIRNLQTGVEQRILVNTNVMVCYDWEPDDSGLVIDYNCGIWRLGTNGTMTQVVTTTDCYGQAPVLNPQDGRIAYHDLYFNPATLNTSGLYVASFSGTFSQRITTNIPGASWPEWSPDGNLVSCSDDNSIQSLDNGTNLWVVAPDGSSYNRICDFSGTSNRFPHGAIWSPDGASLVGAATLYTTNGIWIIPLNADRSDCGGIATLLPTTPGDAIDFAGTIVLPNGKPVIIAQPASVVVQPGQPATVTVAATGAAPLHYEWIKDGVLLPNETSNTIYFPSFKLTNSGVYQVVVTNYLGLAISLPARVCLSGAPLRGWGDDDVGELGDGMPLSSSTNLPELMTNGVVAEAVGGYFSMYVTADGKLYTMGWNEDAQLGLGVTGWNSIQEFDNAFDSPIFEPFLVASNVTEAAAGYGQSLFVTGDGNLWAMGNNVLGELGAGVEYFQYPQFTNVICLGCGALQEWPAPLLIAGNVVAVAGGTHHSLFVKADGSLWAMGENAYGQLGNGSTVNSLSPIKVANNVVAVAAGDYHSLYITADGGLWAMGYNISGELGDGTTNQMVLRPERVTNNVVAIAGGTGCSYFVTADGILHTMGLNLLPLGLGPPTNGSPALIRIPMPVASNVVYIAAGQGHAQFIKTDGSLWAMGDSALVLGVGTNFTNGEGFYPVLVNGGALIASSVAKGPWGQNSLAVVGKLPVVMPLTNETLLPGQSYTFTAIFTNGDGPSTIQWQFNNSNITGATNDTYSINNATLANAGLYTVVVTGTYGSGSASANLFVYEAPTIVSQSVGSVVLAGQPASLSVTANVTLPLTYEWIKDGVLLPEETNSTLSFPSFQLTNTGAYQALVANADGIALSIPALMTLSNAPLRAWGYNGDGELGDGTTVTTNLPVFITNNVAAEAVGAYHSLFVKGDGTLWGMGYNNYGQLGNGNENNTNVPIMITNNTVATAAGTEFSLFLTKDGNLWGTGYGANIWETVNTNRPTFVTNNVALFSAGDTHILYVTQAGTLWGSGNNEYGQLGIGTPFYTNHPTMVHTGVVAVAAGADHTLFVTSDGTLWGMGLNEDGELGDGNYNNTNLPVMITNNVVGVAAGGDHSLFLKTDNTLWGMGYNVYGQLGPSFFHTNLPVLVATNVVAFTAGEDFTLYVTADGNLWGRGYDANGELGIGTAYYGTNPAPVNGGGLLTASLAKGPMAYHVLAISAALPVLNPLTNQTVLPTQPFSFTAVVTAGDGPFTYQWQLDGTNLTGATSATYSVASASASNDGTYTVVVTSPYGSVSASATLNVNYLPMISNQPIGSVVVAGQPASVNVVAVSYIVPVTYEWMKDGKLLPSQTNSLLSFASFQLTNSGVYQVVVSNAAGLAISRPVLLDVTGSPFRVWGYNDYGQLGINSYNNAKLPVYLSNNVVAEAVGGQHSLFVKADRTLWAMGYNGYGQLGDGGNNYRDQPEQIETNVVTAAAGEFHSLYLTADGKLWAMGQDSAGQLGDRGSVSVSLPETVATNVVAIAAGYQHSLYVKADGTLWAMGNNAYGQLGNGTENNTNQAVMVTNNVVAVAAGTYHSLFLKADGTLWGMGYNGDGELGDGGLELNTDLPEQIANNVVAIAAGESDTLYLTADGNLWATGDNTYGELGDGGLEISEFSPEIITNNVVAIAGQATDSLYVKADGSLWAMGDNTFGELGNQGGNSTVPVLVNGGGITTASLAKGGMASHSLAVAGEAPSVIVYSNQVVFSGQSFEFDLAVPSGDGPLTFQWQLNGTNIPNATGSVYSGSNAGFSSVGTYTVVVTGPYGSGTASATLNVIFVPSITHQPTGSVVSVGRPASVSVTANSLIMPVNYQWLKDGAVLPGQTSSNLSFASFQLINSGTYQVVVSNADGLAISVPALLTVSNAPLRGWGANYYGQLGGNVGSTDSLPAEITTNVVTAAVGGEHSLYVTADGNLWALGYDFYGQLGNGSLNNTTVPFMVATNVVAAAAGEYHSLYVTADGTLWAMGQNNQGQLGTGNLVNEDRPVIVTTNVVAVGAGYEHSLYLTADGKLWAVGNNQDGQLGDGNLSNTSRAVFVTNNVMALAAGGFHSLFLKTDRTLWGMGYNGDGELGDRNYANANLPVPIATNVVAAAAGDSHSLYITADGTLWGMGENFYGELGNGTQTGTDQPVIITGDVVAASAGAVHSLYVTGGGTLWAMGYNDEGQLGDNSYNNAYLPVQVNNGDMLTASLAKGPMAYHGLAVAGAAPLVINLPNQTVYVGQPFYFSPTFEYGGDYPDTYQWQFNGVAIPGATNDAYIEYSAATNESGLYTLLVTGPFNSSGGTYSSATLTVFVQPPPPSAPIITRQPTSTGVMVGQPASVSATVTGTTPIAYEWIKDGVLLPNQTNSTLSFPSFQLTNSGAYQVVLSNALGFAISMPAFVSVTNAPLRVWGFDNYSQLGDGGNNYDVYQPEEITTNVVAEAVGSQHSLYVTADGTLWAMGYNGDGELGDGTYNDQYLPEAIPTTTKVVAVAAGEFHSLFLTADGTLWAMGQNGDGQLGDDTSNGQIQPEAVATNVVEIAAWYHSLYVTADGKLWAMGDDAQGQLGDGTNLNEYQAEQIATNVVAIAAGEEHSLYVTADGTLWAMGDNTDGELGDGGLELNVYLPEMITNDVVSIAAGGYHSSYGVGGYHSLYITADGNLWAMGYNGDGELGDGGLETNVYSPEMVENNVVAVAAGAAHSLYITGDGNLWAMGDDTYGELGNYYGTSYTPVLVNYGGMVGASLAKGEAAFHALSVAGQLPQISLTYPTVTNGQSYTFSASVYNGDGPFTYQWQFDYDNITGATNTTLSGTNAQFGGQLGYVFSDYTIVVTGAYGSDTAYEYFYFIAPPPSQPRISVEAIQTNGFYLHVTGATNITYTVEASTDFKTWLVIGTATQTGPTTYDFLDTNSYSYPYRFYRIQSP